jgi:hypothetical protein
MIVTTAMPDERCGRGWLRNAARVRTHGSDRAKRTTALDEITWRIPPAISGRPDWPLLPFFTRRGGAPPAKAGMQIHESLRSRQDDGRVAAGIRPPGSIAEKPVTDLYHPFLRFPRRAA